MAAALRGKSCALASAMSSMASVDPALAMLGWMVGGPLLLGLAAGALDLVRRDEAFHPGLAALALWLPMGMLPVGAILGWRRPQLGDLSMFLACALLSCAWLSCVLVSALALSRSLRPHPRGTQPTRHGWRKGRLTSGLLILSGVVLLAQREPSVALLLPLLWACTAAMLGLARDGGARLEQGGAVAVSLLALGAAALVGGLWMAELGQASQGGPEEPPMLARVGVPALLAVAMTWAVLGRTPSLLALGPGLPGALAVAGVVLGHLGLPNPAVSTAPMPQLVDLAGREAPWLDGERGHPPSCVHHLDGRSIGRCEEKVRRSTWAPRWHLPPDLPLAEVEAGAWVVHRPRRGLGSRLGYRALELANPLATWTHQVQVQEVEGQAVLQGVAGMPQGRMTLAELHEAFQRWPLPGSRVRVELPRSRRWTVQDAVSICASAARSRGQIGCALAP
jgi:hypothetical protein